MIRLKKIFISIHVLVFVMILTGCSVKYSFNAGAIDYSKYSSISIADFPNNAELVNPTLSQIFAETLRDKFTRQTRLQVLKQNGNMHLEGEIVGYQLTAMAISADSYASETKLTLTINVRFVDSKNPENSFNDSRYIASQIFDSNRLLSDVEPELIDILVKEIVDKIYNDTVAKW
ncbi:MAG: LptE family protein [Paludibacteraceae bacterium]